MHECSAMALKHSVGFASVVNVLNSLSPVWNCKESLSIFFFFFKSRCFLQVVIERHFGDAATRLMDI